MTRAAEAGDKIGAVFTKAKLDCVTCSLLLCIVLFWESCWGVGQEIEFIMEWFSISR